MQFGLHRRHYRIHDIVPYINWIYFYHAWGFQPKYAAVETFSHCPACMTQWVQSFPEEERGKAREAVKLYKEAQHLLFLFDAKFETRGNVLLLSCNSQENNILLDTPEGELSLPLLRQQSGKPPYYCLSDFIRPADQGIKDAIGVFCTTVDEELEKQYPEDDFLHLLAQTLADRLAEATAEVLHLEVRKELWGYAPEENLTLQQLYNEEFQGIRPAIGYPSLPDISLNSVILPLVDQEQLQVRLTENSMMLPHASVSGFMISHPKSCYFNVGKIGKDQFLDYTQRRGKTPEEFKPYLLANL